jgi:hypothetical protein
VQTPPPLPVPEAWAFPYHTLSPQARYPPVREPQLLQAEQQLGFRLPSLLRTIYLTIANGGFGPGYGILPLLSAPDSHDESLVTHYRALIDETTHGAIPPWPAAYLPICDWGCTCSSSIKWTEPEAPIFFFDGNMYDLDQPWETAMTPEASSLYMWLDNWVRKERSEA